MQTCRSTAEALASLTDREPQRIENCADALLLSAEQRKRRDGGRPGCLRQSLRYFDSIKKGRLQRHGAGECRPLERPLARWKLKRLRRHREYCVSNERRRVSRSLSFR